MSKNKIFYREIQAQNNIKYQTHLIFFNEWVFNNMVLFLFWLFFRDINLFQLHLSRWSSLIELLDPEESQYF